MGIAGENEALLSSISWGKYKYRIIEHEIKSAKTSIFKKQRKMCCQKRGILWEFSEWGEGVSAIPIAMLDNTAQLRKMAKTFGIPYWGEESAKVGKFSLYCFFG